MSDLKAREEIAARVGMLSGVAGWSENLGGLVEEAIVCKDGGGGI